MVLKNLKSSSQTYVLISQGIKIDEPYDKNQAEFLVQESNEKWYIYKQKCLDNNEAYVDNEVEIIEIDE